VNGYAGTESPLRTRDRYRDAFQTERLGWTNPLCPVSFANPSTGVRLMWRIPPFRGAATHSPTRIRTGGHAGIHAKQNNLECLQDPGSGRTGEIRYGPPTAGRLMLQAVPTSGEGSTTSWPPPPPALGSASDAPGERSRATLPKQVGWTTAGLVSLFSLVLIAHATQVAFDCTPYGIYDSGGTAGACPVLSWPTLLLLAGFAMSSSAVAVGLSGNLLSRLVGTGAEPHQPMGSGDSRRLALEFAAPFLTFFGWGLLAWGLTEPALENCIEPCGYPTFPYMLGGTALQLSVMGGCALLVGGGLLALIKKSQRDQRPAGW
jgi:hypothetical protein